MADLLTRATIVLAAWSLGLFLFNPWFEGRKRFVAMFCCAIAASVCFIFQGVV